jgi:hypothetical protein
MKENKFTPELSLGKLEREVLQRGIRRREELKFRSVPKQIALYVSCIVLQ